MLYVCAGMEKDSNIYWSVHHAEGVGLGMGKDVITTILHTNYVYAQLSVHQLRPG